MYTASANIREYRVTCFIEHVAKGWVYRAQRDKVSTAEAQEGGFSSPQEAARGFRKYLIKTKDTFAGKAIVWEDRDRTVVPLENMLSPEQEEAAREKGYLDKTCPKCSGTGKFTRGNANSPDGKSTSPCPRCFEIGRLWGTEGDWERDSRRIANQLKSDQGMAQILGE